MTDDKGKGKAPATDSGESSKPVLPSIKDAPEGSNVNPFTFDLEDEDAIQNALGQVTDDMTDEQRMEVMKKFYKNEDIFDKHKEQWNQLSEKDKSDYKEMGEQIYSCMNEDGTMKDPLDEALAYIEVGLNSGIHPRDLAKNEHQVLLEKLGKEWYTKWRWTEDDMKEVPFDPEDLDEAQ